MKRKWIWATVLGVGVVLAATVTVAAAPKGGPAFAEGRDFARRPGARWLMATRGRLATLKAELNVTPEQQKQIKEVMEKRRPEIMRVVKRVRDKARILRSLTRTDSVDEAAIRTAARDMADVIGDGAVLRARLRNEIRPIFTDEQRRRLDACRANIEESLDRTIEEASKQ